MATDTMYLENLDQWIIDENKIVTYRFISNELQVPIDCAKQMLFHFLERNSAVEAVYLVSGYKQAEQCYGVELVSFNKLEAAKKTFSRLMSVHIYSLQKKIPTDSAHIWSSDHNQMLTMQRDNPYTQEAQESRVEVNKVEKVEKKPTPVATKSAGLNAFFQPKKEDDMDVDFEKPAGAKAPAKKAAATPKRETKKAAVKPEPKKKEEPKKAAAEPKRKAATKAEPKKSPEKKQATKKADPKKSPEKKSPAKSTRSAKKKKDSSEEESMDVDDSVEEPKKGAKKTNGKKQPIQSVDESETANDSISFEDSDEIFQKVARPSRLVRKADKSSSDSMEGVYGEDSESEEKPKRKKAAAKQAPVKDAPRTNKPAPEPKPEKKKKSEASSKSAESEDDGPKKKRAPKKAAGTTAPKRTGGKRKRSESDTVQEEKDAEKTEQQGRKFMSYFNAGGGALEPSAPKIMKQEVTTVKKEVGGWMVFTDEKKMVEDKVAQEKVVADLKREREEPAQKKRKVEPAATTKQGTLAGFFTAKK